MATNNRKQDHPNKQAAAAMGLSRESQKRIALGTAKGLLFNHNDCRPNILHRDLKTANVLLDEALEAHVADFEMARLVSACDTHLIVLCCERRGHLDMCRYYQTPKCTDKGDVHSFRVVGWCFRS